MNSQTFEVELESRLGGGAKPLKLQVLQLEGLEVSLAANQIPSAKVRLAAQDDTDDARLAADSAICRPGSPISIWIKPTSGQRTLLFSGEVAEQEYRLSLSRGEWVLKLRHRLQSLAVSQRSQVFHGKTDSQVLRTLLQEHKITLSKQDGLNLQHRQLVQHACSDWQFVKARLHALGVWLLPDAAGTVAIVMPELSRDPQSTLHRSQTRSDMKPEGELDAASWRFSNRQSPVQLAADGWNIQSQSATGTQRATPSLIGGGGLNPGQLVAWNKQPWLLNSGLDLPRAEMQAQAKSRLLALQAASVQASFTLQGSTQYPLGSTLQLKGFGKPFDGQGIISAVQHSIEKGRWRTTISLGQDSLRGVDDSLVPPLPGLHVGVVDGYQADPDQLNRLRVKVPVLGDKTLWARFSAPYASKNSGVCFYPEPGDEVVLGFFAEDPRYPVVLGAMHNPKNPAPIKPEQGRHAKGLIFKQDDKTQQLLFEPPSGPLTLQSDQDSLVLHKGMALQCSKSLKAQARTISLQASATLEAAGKQSVAIKGAKVDLGS